MKAIEKKNIVVPRDVVNAGPGAVEIYHVAKGRGNSDRMAEMLALRSAPAAETDNTWLAGRGMLRKQFDEDDRYARLLKRRSKEEGFNVNPNSVYLPTLAQSNLDPRAFVSSRGEAVKYAEDQGIGLTIGGREVVKAREPERDPFEESPRLCPKIAREEALKLVKADPKLDLSEATAMAVDKHGSKD